MAQNFRDLNRVPKIIVYIIILVILIWLASALFPACTSPAKIQEKAEQRVLTNSASFNKVGEVWQRLNPCANDTVTVSGGKDTIRQINEHVDTVKGKGDTVWFTKTRTITNTIHDTIHQVVIDRQLQRTLETAMQTKTQEALEQSKIAATEKTSREKAEKGKKMWMWIWIGTVTLVIGGSLLKLFKVF